MKGKPQYKKIYEDVLAKINSGQYLPGDKLPSEKELAEEYNVSRITSKQALEMLATQGMVIRRAGLGTFVSELSERGTSFVETLMEQVEEDKTKPISIGVIFDSFDYAFGCDLLKSIEWECGKNNILMYLKCTYEDIEKEKKAIEELLRLKVSGLLIMCVQNEIFDDKILRCSLDNFPVVLVDRTMAGVAIPCVTTDNYKASKELTDKLFDAGHTHICFVSHINHQTPTIKARFQAFVDSNLEHHIIVDEEKCVRDLKTCTPTGESGVDIEYAKEDEARITEYIRNNPEVTAFFATQYMIGMIIYRAVKKLGLESKIQIVSFDGPVDALHEDAIFARVIQGETEMGSAAVKLLLDKMNGKHVESTVLSKYAIVTAQEHCETK